MFLILTSISNLLSRIGPKFCSFLPFIYAPFYLIISIYTLEFSTRWPFIFHIFMIYLLYMIWGYLTALTHLCLTSVLTSTLHLNKYSSLLMIVIGSCNAIFNLGKTYEGRKRIIIEPIRISLWPTLRAWNRTTQSLRLKVIHGKLSSNPSWLKIIFDFWTKLLTFSYLPYIQSCLFMV